MMSKACVFLIRMYRTRISPAKPYPTCRYTPTCSAYAMEAFTVHGFFRGLALSVWRVLRCNPFSKGGHDPVPAPREPARHRKGQ